MRLALLAGAVAVALGAGFAQAQSSNGMVMDPYAYHPQRLAPGTAEYDYVMRQSQAAASGQAQVDEHAVEQALQACQRFGPLSPATREKCEIKARQTATRP